MLEDESSVGANSVVGPDQTISLRNQSKGKDRAPSEPVSSGQNKSHSHAKYRSRIDIASAMLNAALGGTNKSRLVAQAYVSHPQISEYLSMLLENGMLFHDARTRKYHTTQKGRKLLDMYAEARQIFYTRKAYV